MQVSGIKSATQTPSQPLSVSQSNIGHNNLASHLSASSTGAVTSRLQMLENRITEGRTLSPVEQGDLARMRDIQARGDDNNGGFLDGIKELISKAVETAKKAGEVAKTCLPPTVEGAKTIDDFNLVGASAQDRADFEAMLAYLQQADADGNAVSPTSVELLAQLPDGQTVNINNNHEDYFDPNTGEIGWDPRSALIVNGTDNKQSPALGFIHEVDHAVNGQANPQPTNDDYHNTEEERVITGSEADIARELGEPIRTDHLGDVEHVDSATEHTETNHSPPPRDHSGGGGREVPSRSDPS